MMNYRDLSTVAVQKAVQIRSRSGINLGSPICPFDLSESLGISVRFVDINMEGVYVADPKPRIIVSTLRPQVRRNFTCAHELGHHAFGHGSNLDLLTMEATSDKRRSPEEFAADAFASSLLMPSIGIRRAFAVRGWDIRSPSPIEVFTVACNFGVGYSTLVNYLHFSLQAIGRPKVRELLKSHPKHIKEEILETVFTRNLLIVDEFWAARTIDLEVGSIVLLPDDCLPENSGIVPFLDSSTNGSFIALHPGITRISCLDKKWAIFARIIPEGFIGLSKYRHLERGDSD